MEDEHKPILILYYKSNCPFCKKVLDYLKKTRISIPLKNIVKDEKATEELLHLGGKIQVPCLFIDGTPLYESQTIIDWLEEKKQLFE